MKSFCEKTEIRKFNEKTDSRLEISNVYEQSWKYAYKGIIPQSFLDSIPKGRWADNADKKGMTSLVMINENRIVGTSGFCKSRFEKFEDFGEIVSIYLLPEFIGRGYGRMLFSAAVAELSKMGFEKAFLWVLDKNERAKRFYKNMGFIPSGEHLDENIGGEVLREVQYVNLDIGGSFL